MAKVRGGLLPLVKTLLKAADVAIAFPATATDLPEPYMLATLSKASATLPSDPATAQSVAGALLG